MIGSAVARIARSFGYDIHRRITLSQRTDLDAVEKHILCKVKAYTLTSEERIVAAVRAARYVARYKIPGAIVECGVWRGGSMLAMALALKAEGDLHRDLYLFDTFEGMSEPTDIDRDLKGHSARHLLASNPKSSEIWCCADLADVKNTLSLADYPGDRLHFVKGKVEDTIPHEGLQRIALLRLDTDWYESTAHELRYLYPKLERGGVLIIDDYGHWQGAKRAVDEYFTARANEPILLQTIDYTGRLAIRLTSHSSPSQSDI